VFANIRRQRVWDAIKEANLGMIDRIDMVPLTDKKGKSFQRVFIHFKHWFRNPMAKQYRAEVINGETIKLIYDDPWFWKLVASKAKKPDQPYNSGSRRSKVRMELSKSSNRGPSKLELGDFIPPKTSPPASPTSSMASSPGGTRRFPYPGSHDFSPESSPKSSKKVPPPIKTDLEQPPLPARKRAPASS
jgi:hypothetical protein